MVKSVTILAVLMFLLGCSQDAATGGGGEEAVELGGCCVDAMALVAQMDDCCREGISTPGNLTGCCATGMQEETADADRDACCAKGYKLLEQMSPCCKSTILTGEPGPCCEAMPQALQEAAP